MTGFSKQARLLNKADYANVFSKSVKVSNSFFLILIHRTTNDCSRLGLVISKKVDKRAVQRNRIKRLIRESFRQQTLSKSCDYVFLARPNISKHSNQTLNDAITYLWGKAQLKIQADTGKTVK